jgi:hypothetical protein
VLDACVLYPAPLRDILIQTALAGSFRARWTERIHDEWTRNVLVRRPELATQLKRTRRLMNATIDDCVVQGYEARIEGLSLPDAGDRHVLAAAIHCGAGAIVTFNLKDFPGAVLDGHGMRAWHPDEFLLGHLTENPGKIAMAAWQVRFRLRNPVKTVDEYLGTLETQGLPRFARALRPFAPII